MGDEVGKYDLFLLKVHRPTDTMSNGIAQTRRENHIWFSSRLTNGASKLSFQLKLFLHCKVQLFREQP